jgi:phage tail protein X
MEIYEANRGVLASPQLLPIGVELKLPPRQAVERPLVPVERGD